MKKLKSLGIVLACTLALGAVAPVGQVVSANDDTINTQEEFSEPITVQVFYELDDWNTTLSSSETYQVLPGESIQVSAKYIDGYTYKHNQGGYTDTTFTYTYDHLARSVYDRYVVFVYSKNETPTPEPEPTPAPEPVQEPKNVLVQRFLYSLDGQITYLDEVLTTVNPGGVLNFDDWAAPIEGYTYKPTGGSLTYDEVVTVKHIGIEFHYYENEPTPTPEPEPTPEPDPADNSTTEKPVDDEKPADNGGDGDKPADNGNGDNGGDKPADNNSGDDNSDDGIPKDAIPMDKAVEVPADKGRDKDKPAAEKPADNNSEELPKTGEKSNTWLAISGLLGVTISAILLRKKRTY